MKKTALHFKIAAWSIKNPRATYAAIAGLLVVVLAAGVGTTAWLGSGKKQQTTVVKMNNAEAGTFQREGWKIRGQWENNGVQCVGYLKESNNTRLTSCYTKVNGVWVLKQSY